MAHDPELLDRAVAELRQQLSGSVRACKICEQPSHLFDILDFAKTAKETFYPHGLAGVPVLYFKCERCGFIFTHFFDDFTDEQWRNFVYNAEYAEVDPAFLGLRPALNARLIEAYLWGRSRTQVVGLDFGGGDGTTALLLRNKGWTYDAFDPFGLNDVKTGRFGKYNLCSAFEVFEHLPDPVSTLKSLLDMATPERLTVIVTTLVHDGIIGDDTRLAWWYAAPRNGHVSLFSHLALRALAGKFGLQLTSGKGGTHLLTRGLSQHEASLFLLRGRVMSKVMSLIRK